MENRGLYFVFRHLDNVVEECSIVLNNPEKNCFDEEFANIRLTPSEKERLMGLLIDIVKREREALGPEQKGVVANRVLKYFEENIKHSLSAK